MACIQNCTVCGTSVCNTSLCDPCLRKLASMALKHIPNAREIASGELKMSDVVSPGRLSDSIDAIEIEEVPEGAKVTIFYRHSYLEDPPEQTVELVLPLDGERSITNYMHEIGVVLGLEKTKTLDFEMMKAIPDEFAGTYDPSNLLQVCQLPGRTYWRAEGYR